jgi:FkbM family methyltransferase
LINNFMNYVLSRGMNIDTVYDVGAYVGEFSLNLRREVLPQANYYLFEANQEYLNNLLGLGMSFYIKVLSDGREYVDFYKGLNTGDSYYKETTSVYEDKLATRLPATTLDKMIEEKNLPIPQLLKLDTQGSELDILKGATKVIGKTELIYCECPIIEYNKDAPNINDYLQYFKSFDYLPVEVFQIHRSEDTVLQIDIMFMLRQAKYSYLSVNNIIRV